MQPLISHAADVLLMSASLGAAIYCMILSKRLSRLGSFDKGIGSAIAVLSAQVEEMKAALGEAKAGSQGAGQHLNDLVRQAREISGELEMMIAACHDFAEHAIEVQCADRTGESAATATNVPSGTARPESIAKPPFFGTRRDHGDPASTQPEPEAAIPMFRRRAGTEA